MLSGPFRGRWQLCGLCLVYLCNVIVGYKYTEEVSPNIYFLRPQGVQVSVKGHPTLTEVSFHANINEPIHKRTRGDIDLELRYDGREWVAVNPHVVLKGGDIINYWMHVNIDGKGELLEGRSYIPHTSVNQDNSGGSRLAIIQNAPTPVLYDPEISDSRENPSDPRLETLINSFPSHHQYQNDQLQTPTSTKAQSFLNGQIMQNPTPQYIDSPPSTYSQTGITTSPQSFINPSQGTFITPSQNGFTNSQTGVIDQPSQTGFTMSQTGYTNLPQTGYINTPQTGYINTPQTVLTPPPQTSLTSPPQNGFTTSQTDFINQHKTVLPNPPQTGFTTPSQTSFTPSQTVFINPSQSILNNPSQTGFSNPTQPGFTTSQIGYTNPAQTGYVNQLQPAVTNPSQNGFTTATQNGFGGQAPNGVQIPVIIQPVTYKPPTPVYVPQPNPLLSNTSVPADVPNYPNSNQPDKIYQCEASETTVNGRPVCRDQNIFIDDFNYYNSSVWSYDMEFSSLPDSEFCVFTGLSDNSRTGDGSLKIWPTLTDDKYGAGFVFSGRLDLPDCTATDTDHCTQEGEYAYILPPTMSARYSTKRKWSFKYGRVDIVAKLARGDWLYPELWLVPPERNTRPAFTKRLEIAVVRGNTHLISNHGKEIGASVLEVGAFVSNNDFLRKEYKLKEARSGLWTDDFHTYSLLWTKDAIAFSVDGIEIGVLGPNDQVSSAMFHEEMSLVIGLGVGGVRVFPDTHNKPWTNTEPKAMYKFWGAKDQWHNTWSRDASTMVIKEVKITSL